MPEPLRCVEHPFEHIFDADAFARQHLRLLAWIADALANLRRQIVGAGHRLEKLEKGWRILDLEATDKILGRPRNISAKDSTDCRYEIGTVAGELAMKQIAHAGSTRRRHVIGCRYHA